MSNKPLFTASDFEITLKKEDCARAASQANAKAAPVFAELERLKAESQHRYEWAMAVQNKWGVEKEKRQDLEDQNEKLQQASSRLQGAYNRLKEACEFSDMTIRHALELGYCGEGSTKGMCEEAVERNTEALREAEELLK